jgi:hypothetical protein
MKKTIYLMISENKDISKIELTKKQYFVLTENNSDIFIPFSKIEKLNKIAPINVDGLVE